jgi:anti-sigma regulatory factor (Ser/Thr protein kinase)
LTHAGDEIVEQEGAAPAGEALDLVLPNAIDAIHDALPALERFIASHGLSPGVANRLEVIFEELVSNAIRHGFTPGSDQSVRARLARVGDHVELIFEDDGAPFDPLGQAAPAPFSTLEKATLGGLGIPLVRKMSASFAYERPAPSGRPFSPTNRTIVTVAL